MDIKKIGEVIKIINQGKYKAYLVGGSSRDFIFGRDFTDIDIATNATIPFLKSKFDVENEDGLSVGSIKIRYKNTIMEITRFREETYNGKSSFPKVTKFLEDEEEDAKRRDFTINAIYLDVLTNEIVDPYDGLKDLFSFQLKFIGDPETRIKEDPSRILRGIRIAYKMNFNIEETTNQSFIQYKDELNRLSKGRLQKEIEKMVADFGKERTLAILHNYQIEVSEDVL